MSSYRLQFSNHRPIHHLNPQIKQHRISRRLLCRPAARSNPSDEASQLDKVQQQPQQDQQRQQQQQPDGSPQAVHAEIQDQQAREQNQQPDASAPAGEEQLWWVQKFEQKRQQLEQQQSPSQTPMPQQQQQHEAGSKLQTSAQQSAASGQASVPALQPVPWLRVMLQQLQLAVAVAALILWPASLYRTGLHSGKVWLLFWTYCLFFGGSVLRLLRYGPLASRKQDKQAKSWRTRAAWLLFVAMMPVLHWGALGSYMRQKAAAAAAAAQAAAEAAAAAASTSQIPVATGSFALYDVVGLCLLIGAVGLNWAAARHLGRAYDRVVQPEALVTTGPYAFVQHPIYTSYMLLLCGYAMLLHSFGYAVLALVVCCVYYRSRVGLESDVLQQAFGERYTQYQQATKLFVPFVL